MPPCVERGFACTKRTAPRRPVIGNLFRTNGRFRGQLSLATARCPWFARIAAELAGMEPSITTKRRKPGYEPIFISASESWTSGRFIDHFLIANSYAVSPANRELVRVAMRNYPGPRPIMASDMALYL